MDKASLVIISHSAGVVPADALGATALVAETVGGTPMTQLQGDQFAKFGVLHPPLTTPGTLFHPSLLAQTAAVV